MGRLGPEIRFDDEPPPRTPAPKNRQRWCKGRAGREHVPRLTVPPNHPGYAGTCRPSPDWFRETRAYRERPREWWCYHVLICSACGRHLRPARDGECPDRPVPPDDPPSAVAVAS